MPSTDEKALKYVLDLALIGLDLRRNDKTHLMGPGGNFICPVHRMCPDYTVANATVVVGRRRCDKGITERVLFLATFGLKSGSSNGAHNLYSGQGFGITTG
jgi:hypothetical protein